MKHARSPARAETVGSLLRPAALRAAVVRFYDDGHSAVLAEERAKDASELRATEDEAIREAIRRQIACGLDVITDGEFRRQGWNPATSFLPDAPIEGYQSADDYRITYMKFWRDETGTIVNRPLGPGSVISSPLKLRHDIATNEFLDPTISLPGK